MVTARVTATDKPRFAGKTTVKVTVEVTVEVTARFTDKTLAKVVSKINGKINGGRVKTRITAAVRCRHPRPAGSSAVAPGDSLTTPYDRSVAARPSPRLSHVRLSGPHLGRKRPAHTFLPDARLARAARRARDDGPRRLSRLADRCAPGINIDARPAGQHASSAGAWTGTFGFGAAGCGASLGHCFRTRAAWCARRVRVRPGSSLAAADRDAAGERQRDVAQSCATQRSSSRRSPAVDAGCPDCGADALSCCPRGCCCCGPWKRRCRVAISAKGAESAHAAETAARDP